MPITSEGPVPARALAAAPPIPHEHRNHSPATTSSAPPRDRSRQLRKELDDLTACTDPAEQQRRRHQVIIEYLPMARSIAASYFDHGVERADLEQLAFVGLVKAADRWTPDRCQDFRAFAVPAITGEIKHYLRDHTWLIRQPRKIQDTRQVITDDAERPCLWRECRAADDEVPAATSGAGRQIRETPGTNRDFRLIWIDDDDGAGRILTEERGEDDPGLRGVEDRLTVQRLLATLTVHERRVVQLRFEHDWSQTRIATELGISQMQVSRLLLTITGKLRTELQH